MKTLTNKQQEEKPSVSTFDGYQIAARSTRLPTADALYALLGLSGEVGEFHSLIAKSIRDSDKYVEDVFQLNVAKELGDILWFVAAIADDYKIPLSTIATINLVKLSKRQAKGTLGGSGDAR